MSPRLRHTVFAAFLLLRFGAAHAETLSSPALVADFAPGDDSGALWPSWLATVGDRVYFRAEDPLFGSEPWSSDGTLAGTTRVADLCPGPCSSEPRFFHELGGRVVFLAGSALVALDGDGVEVLRELPGWPLAVVSAGARLYVLVSDPAGARLFVSDGSAAGTLPAPELCGDPVCPDPDSWGVAGGFYFFTRGRELFAAPLGGLPHRLATLGSISGLGDLDGFRIYFRGGGADGYWLFATDGTPEGTQALVPLDDFGDPLVPWRGRVYFKGRDGRLGSSDGTPAGTRTEAAVAEEAQALAANADFLFFQTGSSSEPHVLQALGVAGEVTALLATTHRFELVGQAGERPFFRFYEETEDRLAASDGTVAGTVVIAGLQASGPTAALGGRLFFDAPSRVLFGHSLWTSDGTVAGTGELAIPTYEHRSSRARAYPLDGSLVVTTAGATWRVDPATFAREVLTDRSFEIVARRSDLLFAVEGHAPERRLAAIRDSGITELSAEPVADLALADDGRLYFASSLPGQQLWQSDGTPEGTRLLFDLEPGWHACSIPPTHCGPGLPTRITPSGGRVFFIAGGGEAARPYQLWVWPGDGSPPRALLPLYVGTPLTALPGGRVAAPVPDPATGITTYWVSDGSLEGTRPFATLPYGFEVGEARRVGERLFFTAGGWLWASDAADAPRPLAPAPGGEAAAWQPAGDHLFFPGAGLGFSDGTPAGTFTVPAASGRGAGALAALADQRVVFAAGDDAGDEPWISDGTAAGTARLADLTPGSPGSDPDSFAELGGRLFFQADDGNTGRELWAIDLPPARPSCPADRLCLVGGRYQLKARTAAVGLDFAARRESGNAESGVMSLFSPGNWELLARVAETFPGSAGCYLEISSASSIPLLLDLEDRATGGHAFGLLNGEPEHRVRFRTEVDCAGPFPGADHSLAEPAAAPPRRCAGDPAALCLGPSGRFQVSAEWRSEAAAGPAAPVFTASAESGLFAFAAPGRPDLLVKVLDGCSANGRFWVFAADAAESGWELRIEDRASGLVRIYLRAPGDESSALRDIAAFPCP